MTPDDPARETKTRHARKLCETGAWPEALAFAENWLAENPRNAQPWFFRGAALTAFGRFVEAETSYRRALDLDARDAKTWNNLAILLFENLRRPAEAVRCFQKLLEVEPGNALTWANLASLHGQLGRHADALACAERALVLDPAHATAHLHRARAAQILGRTEILREASAALATLPPEKFNRAGQPEKP